jgi:Arc/MetJ-type ribon-helix-helix transcriptional regulator
MPRLTITITEDQSELLENISSDDGEYESKSAAVRDFIQAGEQEHDLHEEIARLEERLDSRENRINELEEQLARRSQLEEKVENLPAKIRERESYQERRQRMLDEASLGQRIKWKVTGVPVEQESEQDRSSHLRGG